MLPIPFVLPRGGLVVDETDPLLQFTGTWDTLVADDGYYGGRMARALAPGATVSMTFVGSHVWYYSDFAMDHGRFGVRIDGGAATNMSSYSPTVQVIQSLFDREVAPGQHTITLENLEHKVLTLDFFVYTPILLTSVPSSSSTSSSSSSTFSSTSVISSTLSGSSSMGEAHAQSDLPTPQDHNGVAPGTIVGIVISIIAVMIACVLAFLLVRSRRRAAHPLTLPEDMVQSTTARPPSYSLSASQSQSQLITPETTGRRTKGRGL